LLSLTEDVLDEDHRAVDDDAEVDGAHRQEVADMPRAYR